MGTTRRTRLTVDDRRERLIECGTRIFSECPYDEVSTEEIARRAGISKGLLYHYFSGKRQFYVETIRAARDRFVRDTAPRAEHGAERALRGALEAFVTFVERNNALFRALVRGGIGSDAEVDAIVEEVRDLSMERLATLLGITRVSPRLRLSLYGWIGMAEFVMHRWSLEPGVPREELVDLLIEALRPTRRAWERETPRIKKRRKS